MHIPCVKVESHPDVDSRRLALNGVVFTVNASVAKFLRVRVVLVCMISESLSHLAFTDSVAFVVNVFIQSFVAFQIGSSIPADVHSGDSVEEALCRSRVPSGMEELTALSLTFSLKGRPQNRAK